MHNPRADLADVAYFLAIARHRSFRRAAVELGVSASALSHALKGLEDRLGVRLVNRTSRSVTLTAAGEELQEATSGPLAAVGEAFERLNRFRDNPKGRVRLNVMGDAAVLLIGPVLPAFMDRYPDIELEIFCNNQMVDITDEGFDAGVRYGGTVPEDMIAQRVSAEMHWVVAGAPAYFARFGEPAHPCDLARHRCLRLRSGNDRIIRWDFDRDGEHIEIDVPGAITVNHSDAALPAMLAGGALGYAPEPLLRPYVEAGQLRIVLPEWASPGGAFHVYYSSRRNAPVGLRLLVELLREMRPVGY